MVMQKSHKRFDSAGRLCVCQGILIASCVSAATAIAVVYGNFHVRQVFSDLRVVVIDFAHSLENCPAVASPFSPMWLNTASFGQSASLR